MSDDTSVVCRECGDLVSGVEAGRYVRWVVCPECDEKRTYQRPTFRGVRKWLHEIIRGRASVVLAVDRSRFTPKNDAGYVANV